MSAREASPIEDRDLNNRIRYDVTHTLVSLGPMTFVISAINAGIAYYILRETSSRLVIALWLLLMLAAILARLLMVLIFLRTEREAMRLTPWTFVYLVLVYLTAIGWGVLPLTEAFRTEAWAWGFIVFLIAGMAAGGLITLYAKLSAVIPYLILILLPLMYALARGNHPADFAMSVLTGLFLVTLVRTSYYLNSLVIKAIRLDTENRQLFDFLMKVKQEQE